ncbi:MAG: hypothetical protein WD768_17585 [Phycisphaeraceae bacterium]
MLIAVAYLLNLMLVVTGVWQYIKLNFVWAFLAIGIGALNLLVLWLKRTTGLFAALAAIGSLIVLVQGIILAYGSASTFIDQGDPSASSGFWDMLFTGHDLSYALAYIGAGLITLVILVSDRKARTL